MVGEVDGEVKEQEAVTAAEAEAEAEAETVVNGVVFPPARVRFDGSWRGGRSRSPPRVVVQVVVARRRVLPVRCPLRTVYPPHWFTRPRRRRWRRRPFPEEREIREIRKIRERERWWRRRGRQ